MLFSMVLYTPVSAQTNQNTAGPAASRPTLTIQLPAPPAPVPVSLKPRTTALIVLDMAEATCKPQARCMGQMLPAISALLSKARQADVYVVYSRPPTPSGSELLPEVAPQPGDGVVSPPAQDKFFGTELDAMLKAKGVSTVIITGWRVNGAAVYTSVGATLRGYTVVVPEDTSLAPTDYDVAIGRYQILTQLSSNATNEPLKPKASTLSRSDLITFE